MPSGIYKRPTLVERFWMNVVRLGNDSECWGWSGSKQIPSGYGVVRRYAKHTYAHRLSYQIANGPIGDGLEIDHLCKNPPCSNPKHLEAVTHRENLRRGDGASGANYRKTSCIRGHDFSGENLILLKDGRRDRRTCRKSRNKFHGEKRRNMKGKREEGR